MGIDRAYGIVGMEYKKAPGIRGFFHGKILVF